MNNFLEKWNTDQRFKTKVKLSLYTLFVVLVAIFAISNRSNIPTNELQDYYDTDYPSNEEEPINVIEIPESYNYTINITINDINYKYTGTKDISRENITKEVGGIINNYIYEENSYYKEEEGNYILTTEDEVYDIVDHNYLDLETINEYLSKSTEEENQYKVYLKDIILGYDSEKYMTIIKNENQIEVDYTTLMKNFDKKIDKYLVKIEIEEIE